MILTQIGYSSLNRTSTINRIIIVALITVVIVFIGLFLLRGKFVSMTVPLSNSDNTQIAGEATLATPLNLSFQMPHETLSPTISQALTMNPLPQPSWEPPESGTLPVLANDLGTVGTFSQGSPVEIILKGPFSDGSNRTINPFRIQVDVLFSRPDGQVYQVPAFFDGDGAGGSQGNIWKVRFRPDAPGLWKFVSNSPEAELNGISGQFEITSLANTPAAPNQLTNDFNRLGMLRYAGGHYLRFSNGDYWIKAGIDDPENFLGDAIGDWNAKKSAVDYLSSKGVNSIYIITMNIDGDRKDTWPWLGKTQEEAKANSDLFDVAKLQLWEDLFTYIQERGIVLHLVLADDSAWDGFDHELYYREMVARFGHHPALIWNLGEEAYEIYTNQEQVALAGMLRDIDPYDHPVTVHRTPIWPFLGKARFDAASIQSSDGGKNFDTAELGDQNEVVITHRNRNASEGRPIPIMIDELARITQVTKDTPARLRSKVLYPIYFGGGNFELHYYDAYGQGGSVSLEDLAPLLDDMRRVRELLETLPFNAMQPCNDAVSGDVAYCFGKSGEIYAIYLPAGSSIQVELPGDGTTYNVFWFNPRTGEKYQIDRILGGAQYSFNAPDSQDWALILQSPSVNPGGGMVNFLPMISGKGD